MSKLSDLIAIISQEKDEREKRNSDSRPDLSDLLFDSIRQTNREIKDGEEYLFQDLTIVNLLIKAVHENYETKEVEDFVLSLKNDEEEQQ